MAIFEFAALNGNVPGGLDPQPDFGLPNLDHSNDDCSSITMLSSFFRERTNITMLRGNRSSAMLRQLHRQLLPQP